MELIVLLMEAGLVYIAFPDQPNNIHFKSLKTCCQM